MLGDLDRDVDVYVPAGHDGRGLPLLVDLVGFTGSGLSHTNWTGFRENMPERLDRLIGEERMPPVVVAFPDCFTRLGGNQYINSASTGAWEDFLLRRCCRRSSSASAAAARAARRVRQEFRRLRRDHARAAPLRRLGGRGVPFRRYGLRALLSARHARRTARARRHGELDRALVAAARSSQEAPEGPFKVVNVAGDGGELRSGPDAVPRHAPAGHARHLRGHRGALGQLAARRTRSSRSNRRRTICAG